MTKRAWWALTLLALALIIWGGWTAYQRWQGRSGLAEIRQRGALRVGLDASFPPFESLDEDGQVVGLDADIARAIADDLGVEVQFVNIGFDGLYDALLIKRVDVLLSGLPIDPYRSRDVAYSVNYFNAGQVLVTRRDDIHTKMDTAGKSVAVEWGSLGDMEARRLQKTLPGLQINSQPDAQSALQFDIAIVDGVNAVTQPQMRVVIYLSNEWYAAAVAVNNRALLAEINKTLTRLIESGEMERLQKQRIMNGE